MNRLYSLILGCLLISTQASAQSDSICECYSKVKTADVFDLDYRKCLKMHRDEVEKQNEEAMKLMRSGQKSEMEAMKEKADSWKECFKPEVEKINSELVIQFKDHLGKEVELFFDVDFTEYNKYSETGYIEIDFANYNRLVTWSPPEGAFTGKISIVKKDSLSSPLDFSSKTYRVKRSGEDLDEYFTVNYNYLNYKHNGGFHKALPSSESFLKVIANTGRYIELEFTHISEQGDVLKGTFQCVYPFTQFE